MDEKLNGIFQKILNNEILFDDEVEYLKKSIEPVLRVWGLMFIDDVKDLIEEVWDDAQDDLLHDMPSWRSINDRETNKYITR